MVVGRVMDRLYSRGFFSLLHQDSALKPECRAKKPWVWQEAGVPGENAKRHSHPQLKTPFFLSCDLTTIPSVFRSFLAQS